MFTAALFTVAKMWKEAKCPSADWTIKKLRLIYTMEYHSAIKIKEHFSLLQAHGWASISFAYSSHLRYIVCHYNYMTVLDLKQN